MGESSCATAAVKSAQFYKSFVVPTRRQNPSQSQQQRVEFVSVRLPDGRWFRTLTVLDLYSRESLAVVADRSLTGVKVAAALTAVLQQRRAPHAITVDNGSEFVSRAMDSWPMRTACASTSFDRASPWRTRSSKASLASCATNA